MPKKILPDEEFEEEEMDEEDDEIEDDKPPIPAPVNRVPRGRPRQTPQRQPKAPIVPQNRFSAFAQQAGEGIMDNETQEIISTNTNAALANIIERLERIEVNLGAMMQD